MGYGKKERVFQLTCCGDTGRGCAADYLLEGENKENYQAGTVIHDVRTDLNFFYRKDLIENGICENDRVAKRRIKEEIVKIKKNYKKKDNL